MGHPAAGEIKVMTNWKRARVSPTTKIKDVLKVIDSSDLQIALVVDKRDALLGTITDGDIRRGILKGIGLNDEAKAVMNPKPITSHKCVTSEEMLARMQKASIHQMPIVDDSGRVIEIELLDHLIRGSGSRNNIVVLMAGGLGTRLRPLTDDRPKSLLPVGNKPILETILENFIEHGFRNFFISVNYKDEMIREYFGDGSRLGINIKYLKEKIRLGTAGALTLLPQKPQSPMIIMNGDLLTKVNFTQLLNFHKESGVAATMCVREYDFQVPYGVVRMEKNYISSIDEKPVQKFFVNAGIYVLDPLTLKHIPKDTAFDMPKLFQKISTGKQHASAFPIREYWLDIGRMEDFNRANGDFQKFFQ